MLARNILDLVAYCIPCLKTQSSDNTRQSEIEISHNIFLDQSMNVCVIDEILSPMYEDGNCKSPSFRLSYDGTEEEEQEN